MDNPPPTPGIADLASNSRLVLTLAVLLMGWEQYLLANGFGIFRYGSALKISEACLTLSAMTAVGVLLRAPFNRQRDPNLDARTHKGIELFYGFQLGAFFVGIAAVSYAFLSL